MISCSILSSRLIRESAWRFGVLVWNGFVKKSTSSLKAAISWLDAVLVPEASVRWKSSTLQSLSTDFWIIANECQWSGVPTSFLNLELVSSSDTKILLNHQRENCKWIRSMARLHPPLFYEVLLAFVWLIKIWGQHEVSRCIRVHWPICLPTALAYWRELKQLKDIPTLLFFTLFQWSRILLTSKGLFPSLSGWRPPNPTFRAGWSW